jgi:hypothetical protein
MKKTIYFALMSAALGSLPAFADVDCVKLSVSVKHAVAAERSSVLEIVTAQINANPGCACEVVKAAIEGVNADAATVGAIVEAAVVAAPDQMRLISQCAVAVAPDALANVQSVLAKLDPNKGEGGESAKSAKSAKSPKGGEVAPETAANPLDFPGKGLVGPRPGDPGSYGFIRPGTDPNGPGSVNLPDEETFPEEPIPEVTDVDFIPSPTITVGASSAAQ